MKIQGSTNISDDEIAKAKADGEKFAEEDRRKREIVESKNRLEALAYQIETTMDEQKDKIPAEEKDIIGKLIADAKALKEKEDVTKEEIDAEIERIEKEFQTLAQKYQATPSSETPNPNEEIPNDTVEGEVIDADQK